MSVRTARAALVALLFAGLPVASFAGVPQAGDPAPGFSLKRLNSSSTQTLSALKGKPVYLNFFASWCGPCNDEAPSIVKLYDKYHPKGLVVVGIDELDPDEKTLAFVKQYKLPYEVVTDSDGVTGKAYYTIGLPMHVFIDRSGKISTFRQGEMTPDEIEAAIKKIVQK